MTHWAKFAEAERDLHDLITEYSVPFVTNPEKNRVRTLVIRHAKMAIHILQTGQRFYLPDAVNLFEDKYLSPDIKQIIKTPYPLLSILSECDLIHPDQGEIKAWKITCLMSPERLEKLLAADDRINKNIDQVFLCYSLLLMDRKWQLLPLPASFISTKGTPGFTISIVPTDPQVEASVREVAKGTGVSLEEEYQDDFNTTINLCAVLNTKNCRIANVAVPQKLAKSREKRRQFPLYNYHVLEVGGEVWDSPHTKGDGTQGFRSHLRRGHIRRLGPDHTVWVRHTFVHGRIPGFVDKDYDIKNPYSNQPV